MHRQTGFTLVEVIVVIAILVVLGSVVFLSGCSKSAAVSGPAPVSSSGVAKATAKVNASASFKGKKVTAEQWNILTRYDRDDDATALKHLYIISAFSGDCILYSTVRGKVTSSGKRLTPYSIVAGGSGSQYGHRVTGVPVSIGGRAYETTEVLQDDGTYGSSIHYLVWFDARGAMHKHYPSGGQIVHISDTPMSWPKIILNLETTSVSNEK